MSYVITRPPLSQGNRTEICIAGLPCGVDAGDVAPRLREARKERDPARRGAARPAGHPVDAPGRAGRVSGYVGTERYNLLDLDLRSSLHKLGLDGLGLFLLDAFLDRLRRVVDEVLGFLQAQPGQLAHNLEHGDLLVAGA